MIQWPKKNDALGTANRGNPCEVRIMHSLQL